MKGRRYALTSRERIKGIFTEGRADRVGCFEQSITCSAASDILGRRAFTGGVGLSYHEACAWWEGGDEGHREFLLQVMRDVIEISDVLGLDVVRPVWQRIASRPIDRLDEYTFVFEGDAGKVTRKFDPDVETWGVVRYEGERMTLSRIVEGRERLLDALDEEACRRAVEPVRRYREAVGDRKAIVTEVGFIQIPMEEEWLLACAAEPETVERYLDCATEEALRLLPFAKESGADLVWAGGDLADNRGVVYGPERFRTLLAPRLKRIVEACHGLGLPYVFRSDGNLWEIADDLFLDIGVDGYGEIDVNAGMNLKVLRDRYPRLVLFGSVRCELLRDGARDEVVEETRRCIDATGGMAHVMHSSNAVLSGTPAENVLAMFETARTYLPLPR